MIQVGKYLIFPLKRRKKIISRENLTLLVFQCTLEFFLLDIRKQKCFPKPVERVLILYKNDKTDASYCVRRGLMETQKREGVSHSYSSSHSSCSNGISPHFHFPRAENFLILSLPPKTVYESSDCFRIHTRVVVIEFE